MAITNATKLAGYVGGLLVGDGTTGSFAAENIVGDRISTLGVVVSGVATATQFDGNITGTAATFTGNVTIGGTLTATQFNGNITGTAATITGNVTVGGNVSIAGTLTYEDVTNIDSIGLITARSGIEASGIITARAGFALTYYGDGSGLTGISSWDSYDTWLFGGS